MKNRKREFCTSGSVEASGKKAMTRRADVKAAEILGELRQSGAIALHSNWRRDHLLLTAVRLLARRGLVACQQGRLVLHEGVKISTPLTAPPKTGRREIAE